MNMKSSAELALNGWQHWFYLRPADSVAREWNARFKLLFLFSPLEESVQRSRKQFNRVGL